MGLYLDVRFLNTIDMKKLLFVLVSALLLGACAQRTCPTYSYNGLESDQEALIENQAV